MDRALSRDLLAQSRSEGWRVAVTIPNDVGLEFHYQGKKTTIVSHRFELAAWNYYYSPLASFSMNGVCL